MEPKRNEKTKHPHKRRKTGHRMSQEEIFEKLIEAIKNDDVSLAKKLLKVYHPRYINAYDEEHPCHTLLTCAAENCPGMCQALLKKGADVNLGDGRGGDTALITAVSHGFNECCKILIEHGADVNQIVSGWTPLLRAVLCNTEACRILAEAGADVNKPNNEGETPLTRAASDKTESGTERCKILLEYGADVNKSNKWGRTPLMFAISGNIESYRILLDAGPDVNLSASLDGWTPLMYAAYRPNNEICRTLLDLGAEVNVRAKSYGTALSFAVQHGGDDGTECCKTLLEYGADVNQADEMGATALMSAAGNNTECCKILLEKGANVNQSDSKYGSTALHKVSTLEDDWRHNSDEVMLSCKVLLQAGAETEIKDHKGRTPLHKAARCNDKICEILLDAGANWDVADNDGNYPVHRAVVGGKPESLQHLIDKGANVNVTNNNGMTPILCAVETGHQNNIVEILIKAGADVNAQSDEGLTALHMASSMSNEFAPKVVKLLLEAGARFDIATKDGTLPIHCAAKSGLASSLQHLIDRGATINAVDPNGWTALHHAAVQSADNIEVLLSAGADPKIKAKCGRTAHELCMRTRIKGQKNRLAVFEKLATKEKSKAKGKKKK